MSWSVCTTPIDLWVYDNPAISDPTYNLSFSHFIIKSDTFSDSYNVN